MIKNKIYYPLICSFLVIGWSSCKHDYPAPETGSVIFSGDNCNFVKKTELSKIDY